MDILIGNGINLGINNPEFSYDNVRGRFLRCVEMTSSVFKPFISSLSVEHLREAIADVNNIEKIATEGFHVGVVTVAQGADKEICCEQFARLAIDDAIQGVTAPVDHHLFARLPVDGHADVHANGILPRQVFAAVLAVT